MHQTLKQTGSMIKNVTYLSIIANTVLSVLKFVVGILGGSIALVADGIHSLSDMVTDFAVILGAHFGSKKADAEHPYGHGRIETFSALFVALVLLFSGGLIIYRASMEIVKIHTKEEPVKQISFAIFWVALLSVIVKEAIYRVTKRIAVKTHSTAMYANAWHHRSDALSSIAVIIGFIVMKWFGYVHGDQVAAIAVGLMIAMVSIKIISGCLGEYTERAVDTATIQQIKDIINADTQVRRWHKLRTRTVGREIFLDLHILVDPNLNIAAAHQVSDDLENALHEQMNQPVNITIHIEPDTPAQQREIRN